MENIDFKCLSCGKQFRDNANLKRHQSRKTPCLIRNVDPVNQDNPLRCIYCNKVLSKKEHLIRHHRTCKIKNGGTEILADKVRHEQEIRILKEQIKQSNEQHKRKDEQIATLVNRVDKLEIANSANTVNNINNTTINNTTNITINHYLKPNTKYLETLDENGISENKKIFSENLVQTPMKLIQLIWFNPVAPENHSIYIPNKNKREVLVNDGKSRILKSIDVVCQETRDYAYDYTIRMISKLPLTDYQKYALDSLARNRYIPEVNELETDNISYTIYNGRDVVQ